MTGDAADELASARAAQHEAEDALAALQSRVDNAQALALMGDYDWHIATDTNTWSDQLFRIYGLEPQSFNPTYEKFLSFIHPDDRDRIQGIHQAAYASGEPYQMIERIVRPDGEVRHLSSNGQVVVDETGSPIRMLGTCIDITDRVAAEHAREEASNRLATEKQRRAQAVEINDTVLQALSAAGYALELGETEQAAVYLRQSLDAARQMVADLMGTGDDEVALTRSAPASLDPR